MLSHPLHEEIGTLISEQRFSGCEIKRDPACTRKHECIGKQHISLFCVEDPAKKSRKTKYCDVDLLIAKDRQVKVIVEIEESNVRPTQGFGKFLASASSTHYIHGTEIYQMADEVLFIQILDNSKLIKGKTSKEAQWLNIEKSIKEIVTTMGGKIKIADYKLFFGNAAKFRAGESGNGLLGYIDNFLKKGR